jgi:hypothetical protein
MDELAERFDPRAPSPKAKFVHIFQGVGRLVYAQDSGASGPDFISVEIAGRSIP